MEGKPGLKPEIIDAFLWADAWAMRLWPKSFSRDRSMGPEAVSSILYGLKQWLIGCVICILCVS